MEKLVTESGVEYNYFNGELYRDDVSIEFLDSGEEGRVFKDKNTAVKVYHLFPNKKTLNKEEIKTFRSISTKRIILPNDMVLGDRLRGYTMPYINGDQESVFSFSKKKLLKELKLIKADLINLGNKKIRVTDLRDSNYISNEDGFFLIDSGDYSIETVDCSDLNLDEFSDFFLQDVIGTNLFNRNISDSECVDIYFDLQNELYSRDRDIIEFIDDCFDDSLEEGIKRYTK